MGEFYVTSISIIFFFKECDFNLIKLTSLKLDKHTVEWKEC